MEADGYTVKHGLGGVISFVVSGQKRATRLRASTLGDGFDPENIREIIAGKRPLPEMPEEVATPQRVDLIIDIQQRMAEGKGPAYARWAKVYNLKQMATALQYLREQGLTDYDALVAKTNAAVDRAHTLGEEVRSVETRLNDTSELMSAVVAYAKMRLVFDGYKAAKYSKKYLAEYETELDAYRAAKATMNELLGGAKLPKMEALKKKRRELAEEKALCRVSTGSKRNAGGGDGQDECGLSVGATEERKNKEQER